VTEQRSLGWVQALLLTLALSALVWFGVKYAVLAVPVAAVFLWRGDNLGRAVIVGAGAASAAVFAGFHISVFGEITPYSVNSVYEGSGTGQVLDSHFTLSVDRLYRIWGVFIDRRFGLARWAPVLLLAIPGMFLLARRGLDGALIVSLVGLQLLVATFVAITMMGWWFPGRTMATVLPLFAIPMALLLAQGGRAVRILFGALAAYSLLVTLLLARAGHLEQVTVAVDPWEMPTLPFEALAPLFPQYTSWGPETQALNAAWLAMGLLLLVGYAGWRLWGGRSTPTLPQWTSQPGSSREATPVRTTPQA
jgi:hypothetical protein